MEKQIEKLERCMEKIDERFDKLLEGFISLKAEVKEGSKRIKELHSAVMGNGNPERGLMDRVSKTEVRVSILMWVVSITLAGTIGYLLEMFFRK
jgi:hypothetical protein